MDSTAFRQYQNAKNNAMGHAFEDHIMAGCTQYALQGRAEIEKTPEPFRVMKKHVQGMFMGRFTSKAQPDFQGTLKGGQSICFEAKYTTTDKLRQNILTEEQRRKLENHHRLGGVTGVCAGIQNEFYFVPWPVWRDMKKHFGRKHVTAQDLEPYTVLFNGAIMFLDYLKQNGG